MPATAHASCLRLNADDHNWWTTMPVKRHQQSGAEKKKKKKNDENEARTSYIYIYIYICGYKNRPKPTTAFKMS